MKTQRRDTNETPLTRVPAPPEGMNSVAAQIWKGKCLVLKDSGRLTSGTLTTLQTFCNLLADMHTSREMMDAATSGTDLFFRHQKSYNDAAKIQLAYARELGFVPPKKALTSGRKRERIWEGLD